MDWKDLSLSVKKYSIPDNMLLVFMAFLRKTLEVRFFGLPLMRRLKEDSENLLAVLLHIQGVYSGSLFRESEYLAGQ